MNLDKIIEAVKAKDSTVFPIPEGETVGIVTPDAIIVMGVEDNKTKIEICMGYFNIDIPLIDEEPTNVSS